MNECNCQNSNLYKFIDADKLLPWLYEYMDKCCIVPQDIRERETIRFIIENIEQGKFNFQRGGE